MAIIDLDSHLRDGWLLDEIYQLEEPFKQYTPERIGDGKYFYSKFEHQLSPMEDPVANANFKKPITHQVFYNPEANRPRQRSHALAAGRLRYGIPHEGQRPRGRRTATDFSDAN